MQGDTACTDYGNGQNCQNVELPLSHCKKVMVMKGPFKGCCPDIQSFFKTALLFSTFV